MLLRDLRRTCVCVGAFVLLLQTERAFAQTDENIVRSGRTRSDSGARQQLDDIIVSADATSRPSEMAPDTAALVRLVGDLNDPVRALLSLPGLTFGAGDLDRPVMRGAGPDDNLFLIDGVPITNLFHELSDSIISPNVLRDVDAATAAYPLRYGEAVGGVIDVALRQPSLTGTSFTLDASALKAGAFVETAIGGKMAAYADYRVGLAHLFLKNLTRGNRLLEFRMPRSSDYTARVSWHGDGVSIDATALGAFDRRREVQRPELPSALLLGQTDRRQMDAQSIRFTVDLPSLNGSWVSSFAHVHSTNDAIFVNGDRIESRARTWSVRSYFDGNLETGRLAVGVNAQTVDAGLDVRGPFPVCDLLERRCGRAGFAGAVRRTGTFPLLEAYAGLTMPLSAAIDAEFGGRLILDSSLGQTVAEPRFGVTWRAANGVSAYARAGLHHRRAEPARLLLSADRLKQQRAARSVQALAGAEVELGSGWRLQSELWYKTFDQTDLVGSPLETTVDGEAHGIDLLVTRPIARRLTGWLAVSRGWSSRRISPSDSNTPYRYEIPWSGTLAVNWQPGRDWLVGAKWRMQSGVRYTPLLGATFDPISGPLLSYGEPYSARAGAYSRLDLRVQRQVRVSFAEMTLFADALNVLGRPNVAERSFPIRNLLRLPEGGLDVAPDDALGVPRFFSVGARLKF